MRQPRDQVAPLGALGLVVLDRLLGGGVVGADLAEPSVRREGLLGIDELVLVDACELGLHRRLDRATAGERDLELEQPRHGSPLAPLLVAPARHAEEPLHLGVGHAEVRSGDRFGQLVPGRFVLRIVLQPPEGHRELSRRSSSTPVIRTPSGERSAEGGAGPILRASGQPDVVQIALHDAGFAPVRARPRAHPMPTGRRNVRPSRRGFQGLRRASTRGASGRSRFPGPGSTPRADFSGGPRPGFG